MPFKEFREILAVVQAVVTIGAVLVGGMWTYNIFIKERKGLPHLNVEQKVTHIDYSPNSRIVRTALSLSNTGNTLVQIKTSTIRIQQVLPQLPCKSDEPCAPTEVAAAKSSVARKTDRFTWPLLCERVRDHETPVLIEPGEKEELDFEFAVAADVQLVRVHSHFQNEQGTKEGAEIGWGTSTYYDLRSK